MPTYEYACRDCGEHLEVVQSFKDGPLTVCPSCEGELRKVFSAAGIIFKGSGWHIKDYAASRSGASDAGDGASKSDKTDKTDKKADTSSISETSSGSSSSDSPEAKSA